MGGSTAAIAAALRMPLDRWQRHVADVAGEVDADGRFAYPLVILSVPRRAGKTVLMLAIGLHRTNMVDRARGWYTAQTGQYADRVFRDEWATIVKRSPLAGAYKVRLSNGSMAITNRAIGSTWSPFPPTPDAVHGADADVGVIDEAWAHDLITGDAIVTALRPAMLTRPSPQLWIVSAGGDETSTWWDAQLTMAEEHCAAGGLDGVALFDWGASPDGDWTDPAVWITAHPAVGDRIPVEALAGDVRLGRAYFERNILNRWPRPSAAAGGGHVDRADWAAAVDLTAELAPPVTVAYDVSPDRRHAAVAACCTLPDGRDLVTIVATGRGSSWAAGRVRAVGANLVAADQLAGADAARTLATAGIPVTLYGATDMARATAGFIDATVAATLAHHAQPALDDALAAAAVRPLADGKAWSRSRSGVSITELVAATLALYHHRSTPRGSIL